MRISSSNSSSVSSSSVSSVSSVSSSSSSSSSSSPALPSVSLLPEEDQVGPDDMPEFREAKQVRKEPKIPIMNAGAQK